jgi:3-oxoacid CoA-transferase B subunit
MQPFSRDQMARRAADDIPEGWCVNLGIGIPTLVANHVPTDREVVFHSENGILGMGPAPEKGREDPWLVNAGKQLITLVPGASFVGHADSFAMIRGGHIDLCVLGGFEVAENGDLANWATSENDTAPAVGGAMDLAAGAKRLWVLMEHTTKDGRPKVVERCGYPLTGLAASRASTPTWPCWTWCRGAASWCARWRRAWISKRSRTAAPRACTSRPDRTRTAMSAALDDTDRAESIRMIRDSAAAVAPPGGDLKRVRALRFTDPGYDRERCADGRDGLDRPARAGGAGRRRASAWARPARWPRRSAPGWCQSPSSPAPSPPGCWRRSAAPGRSTRAGRRGGGADRLAGARRHARRARHRGRAAPLRADGVRRRRLPRAGAGRRQAGPLRAARLRRRRGDRAHAGRRQLGTLRPNLAGRRRLADDARRRWPRRWTRRRWRPAPTSSAPWSAPSP